MPDSKHMDNHISERCYKKFLYAFGPLVVFYIAAGLAGGCMEMIELFVRERRPHVSFTAAELYALRSLWTALRLVIPAGTGGLAVRPQYLVERAYVCRVVLREKTAFAGRMPAGQGPLEVKAARALAVLMAGTAALSLGINVLFSSLGLTGEGSAFIADHLPGMAGILLQSSVYGLYMPFIEEMLFRGTLFPRLCRIYGRKKAVILSSLIFGLYHWNPAQGVYAFIMGIVFALSYVKTGRITVPWALHGTCNMMVLVLTWTDIYNVICTPAWGLTFLGISAGGFYALDRMGVIRERKEKC